MYKRNDHIMARSIGIDIPVVAGLLFVALLSVAIAWPGLNWMNDYGPKVHHSFNVDDNRFVQAARDFKNPELNRMGYPEGMTTQLFLVTKTAEKLFGLHLSYPTTLRSISLIWAQFTLLMAFAMARWLGLSLGGAILAAFFLAVSPQFVLLASQGTPDMAALGLFYATILAAIGATRSSSSWWFYTACALAGICLAIKFLLPALVPVALLILRAEASSRIERAFLAGCIGLCAFCAANYFNFTPWDFRRLWTMLLFDNVIVVDGKNPAQQIPLYARDLLVSTGLVTSVPALVFLAKWVVGRSPAWRMAASEFSKLQPMTAMKIVWTWLGQPAAMVTVPLLAYLFLIITAQTHSSRHILVYVPLFCIATAALIEQSWKGVQRSVSGKSAVMLMLTALTLWGATNAWMTAYPYRRDIRMDMVHYLHQNPAPTTTHNFHSHVRGTELISINPESARYVTCNRDFARYLASKDVSKVWHPYGGQERVDFLHALFEGKTAYRPVLVLERRRLSLEDRLAGKGWLGELHAFYASKCIVFARGMKAPTYTLAGI